MKYVVNKLMEAPEDKENSVKLTEKDSGYFFLLLKIVIDILDQAG